MESKTSSESTGSPSRATKILYSLITFFLLFAIAETSWRTYLHFTGRGFFDDPVEFVSPFFTLYDEPFPVSTESGLEYRNATVARSGVVDEIRIICFGGSTTVNERAGISYAQLLDKRFAEESLGQTIRVLNAGGEGYSTAHTLVNLALRNLDTSPDIMTVYHNINDLSAVWFDGALTSDYAAKYKSDYYLGFRHRTGIIAAIAKASRLARFIFSNIKALKFPEVDQRVAVSYDDGIEYFKRNLRSIIAVANAHGVQVLLATQAAKSGMRNHEGFRAYNLAVQEVASEEGVEFIDIANILTDDELFLDDEIHYTKSGVTRLSEAFYVPLSAMVDRIAQAKLQPAELKVTSTPPAEAATAPWDQWAETNPSWVESFAPFRVIDNIYYVGSRGLSSFLITSDDGHIIIDGGLPQNASAIIGNIKSLGFDIKDVRILLNSHAHFDHSGGLEALREASGAQLYASEGDRSALEGGFALGSENDSDYAAPPVRVDRVIEDGEQVRLGDIVLTAHLTPGHTRGCTSWWMSAEVTGKPLNVLFFCSASVAGNTLVPPQYEGIVEDYRETFALTKTWEPDVFLANHPSFFDLEAKRSAQRAGDSLAFIDRVGFPKLIRRLKTDFESALATAQSE